MHDPSLHLLPQLFFWMCKGGKELNADCSQRHHPIYHIIPTTTDTQEAANLVDIIPPKQPSQGLWREDEHNAEQKGWGGSLFMEQDGRWDRGTLCQSLILESRHFASSKELSQFRRFSPNCSHNCQNNLYASAFPPQQSWLNKHKHDLRYKTLIHQKKKKKVKKNSRILNVGFPME